VDPQATDVHSEDLPGVLADLLPARGHLDAAQLAASADLNLGLHHARVAHRVGRRDGLVDGRGRTPRRHRHAMPGEQLLSLVLEEVH
jgi:hypothetical protein